MRETAIVITTPHADTIAIVVESNGRRYHDIENFRVEQESAYRFPDAEMVLLQFGIRRDLTEHHLRLTAQNRNEDALVCAPRALDDLARIDFIVHRQEAADRLAREKLGEFADSLADDFRCV